MLLYRFLMFSICSACWVLILSKKRYVKILVQVNWKKKLVSQKLYFQVIGFLGASWELREAKMVVMFLMRYLGSLVMFFIGVAMESEFFLLNSYNLCYLD